MIPPFSPKASVVPPFLQRTQAPLPRFGHDHHHHDEFCSHHSHHEHSHKPKNPLKGITDWLHRFITGFSDDLQAFWKFCKRLLGFKTPKKHDHNCHHHH